MPTYDEILAQRLAGPQGGGDDFGNQKFSDLVAPYQEMAKQFQSPYATIRPNSWLAENHPGAARMLDSIGLNLAMTPGPQGPEGVGGGISRTFQGLLGAQQYRRQMMMQNAMLPYMMMEPRLKAEDTLAQIRERTEHARFLGQHGDYFDAMQLINAGKLDVQQQKADQEKFGRVLNTPEERLAYGLHPFKDPKNPTVDELGAVRDELERIKTGEKPGFGSGATGGFLGQLAVAQTPRRPGQSEADYARDVASTYTKLYGATAGARTAGEQSAPHPYSETKDFIDTERKFAAATIQPPVSPSQFESENIRNPDYWKDPKKVYGDYVQGIVDSKRQMDKDITAWMKSSAPGLGIGFFMYRDNPKLYDRGATPAVAPQSSTPQAAPLKDPYAPENQPR